MSYIYDAIDIGTGICESLYKQYNIATSLLAIQRLIDVTVPIIEGIKVDKCLMNTSILDLNNVVGKQLGSSMNVVIEGFQSYITAIKDKKKDEDNTNIDNAKNVLDARINGYETNTVPNAKTQMDNKCQDDNNESDCIRTARKEFNLNGRKTVRVKPVGNCFVYRRGDFKDSNFTPRNKPPTYWETWSTDVSITRAFIDPNVKRVQIINLSSPNFSFPLFALLDGYNHVSVVASDGTNTGIDINKMLEWSATRLTPNTHPLTTQLKSVRTGEIPRL